MAQLGLCIATNDLVALCWFEEELMLLWRALIAEGSLRRLVDTSMMGS